MEVIPETCPVYNLAFIFYISLQKFFLWTEIQDVNQVRHWYNIAFNSKMIYFSSFEKPLI